MTNRLVTHVGLARSGSVLDFALVIGEDGNMKDVGGAFTKEEPTDKHKATKKATNKIKMEHKNTKIIHLS